MRDRMPATGRLLDDFEREPTSPGFRQGYRNLSRLVSHRSLLLAIYRAMLLGETIDESEADLVARGEAFFHMPSAGHESVAALHWCLSPEDWLHLHYRDRALLLARGAPPVVFFHNLFCNAASASAGRQMAPFFSDPSRKILSQTIPVGNHALQAVGVASAVKDRPERPIVVCSLGDGATQQGEVLEAIAEAVRGELPVLFLVEDNAYSISTTTQGKTFLSLPARYARPERFYGMPIQRMNGRDVAGVLPRFAEVVGAVRQTRSPALIHLSVERLSNHTNADDEQVYRSREEREAVRKQGDPVRNLREQLLLEGVAPGQLEAIAAEVAAEVAEALETARRVADPDPVFDARRPLPEALRSSAHEYRGSASADEPRLTMLAAIRGVLANRLAEDPRVTLLGQDIEDPKGDVFGVTRGLTRAFPGRVQNAPLSESTIIGVSVGRAMAGARPVALIQFADFLALAFNQIHSELGSLFWRSAGGWNAPVIVMVACGGYRPGLGPFHAQTLESILAHVPGVDVLMPSTAADAAGLLNAAFESNRPTIFLYPKICLNDRERTTSEDIGLPPARPDRARRVASGTGDDLTIVVWGARPQCRSGREGGDRPRPTRRRGRRRPDRPALDLAVGSDIGLRVGPSDREADRGPRGQPDLRLRRRGGRHRGRVGRPPGGLPPGRPARYVHPLQLRESARGAPLIPAAPRHCCRAARARPRLGTVVRGLRPNLHGGGSEGESTADDNRLP